MISSISLSICDCCAKASDPNMHKYAPKGRRPGFVGFFPTCFIDLRRLARTSHKKATRITSLSWITMKTPYSLDPVAGDAAGALRCKHGGEASCGTYHEHHDVMHVVLK